MSAEATESIQATIDDDSGDFKQLKVELDKNKNNINKLVDTYIQKMNSLTNEFKINLNADKYTSRIKSIYRIMQRSIDSELDEIRRKVIRLNYFIILLKNFRVFYITFLDNIRAADLSDNERTKLLLKDEEYMSIKRDFENTINSDAYIEYISDSGYEDSCDEHISIVIDALSKLTQIKEFYLGFNKKIGNNNIKHDDYTGILTTDAQHQHFINKIIGSIMHFNKCITNPRNGIIDYNYLMKPYFDISIIEVLDRIDDDEGYCENMYEAFDITLWQV